MMRLWVSMVVVFGFAPMALAQDVTLPEGLGNLTALKPPQEKQAGVPVDLSGFLETRMGARLQNDPLQKDMSLGEARLQIGLEKQVDRLTFRVVSDFIYDPVQDIYDIDLERGQGVIDLREANMVFSPLDFMDVKLGRQIITWGTGDLIFINDLFAKDWNSFFIGRDTEYLKAPSDALKTAFFFGDTNLDVVYVPRFDADRFIDGTRISYFDRARGQLSGRDMPVRAARPDVWFSDDEIALRLYRSFGAYEAALYYYDGYWKSPAGQDQVTGLATFPRLSVYGASLRGPVQAGIGAVEFGYYKSADGAAHNPLVRNDELRLLVSYEQEVGDELTGSLQYYLERRMDYGAYLATLPVGAIRDDRNRHLFTLRLTKLMMQQDLKLSLFNFYSPSDRDGYLRAQVSYKIRDNLRLEAGGNIFYGAETHSFFGQFQDASNVYSALHYDF
ncbi:hypothetical protein [Paremcibacter congregatus]|uniref:hypothetical protein n=1 Tax=Paremcibacter congregatus TaxID=2043170 RepID=UPI003A8E487D